MGQHVYGSVCWPLFLCFTAALPAATITLSVDGTMSASTWSAVKFQDAEGTASFGVNQIGSGGNPGAYWEAVHNYGPRNLTPSATIALAHTTSAFTWNPSIQGELLSVSAAFDARVFSDGDSNAVALGIILSQGGRFYSHFIAAPSESPSWNNYSALLLDSTDFGTVVEGDTLFPDFTPTGGLIGFGFYTANGTALGAPTSSRTGIDNFVLSVEVSPIPEPATASLGAALIVLAAAGLRRRPRRDAESA